MANPNVPAAIDAVMATIRIKNIISESPVVALAVLPWPGEYNTTTTNTRQQLFFKFSTKTDNFLLR